MKQDYNAKKINRLKLQLTAAIILLLIIISGFFIFTPFSLRQVAWALSNNYNKSLGDSLTHLEWNNLPIDFLAKSGDTWIGPDPLDMNSNRIINLSDPVNNFDAVTKEYVDNKAGSGGAAENILGEALRMVCGSTVPGATIWQVYPSPPGTITTTVYTTDDGTATGNALFTSPDVLYFTTLEEPGIAVVTSHRTTGVTSIYNSTATSFQVYVVDTTGTIDPPTANARGWHINWCGVGK